MAEAERRLHERSDVPLMAGSRTLLTKIDWVWTSSMFSEALGHRRLPP